MLWSDLSNDFVQYKNISLFDKFYATSEGLDSKGELIPSDTRDARTHEGRFMFSHIRIW